MTNPTPIDVLEAYKIALDTRNLEIKLFWQRSNYFLVLNTAIGTAFFAIESDRLQLALSFLGALVALLWFCVNLGGKFWQSRWEQQLHVEEETLNVIPPLKLFSVGKTGLEKYVEDSWDQSYPRWRIDRRLWLRLVMKKPSVTLMMTYLSVIVILFWSAAVVLQFVCGT